ncbi:di-heme oxidoredictase family protein [Nioella aestuarii]|uniref:di-heme oxidoreductase family protein n=1 Tax=Nioella aestuarii TaxID=1662864 RepID=UPI003D7FE700
MFPFRPLALALLIAGPATAQDLTDPHLSVIPRTEAEAARVAEITAPPADFTAAWPFEVNSGGAATVRARLTPDAFSQPSGNMSFDRQLQFHIGNGLFRRLWVSAPSSTIASDGLGPLYNARSCQRCHLKDGRGHPPEGPEDLAISMFLRFSIPGSDTDLTDEIEGFLATLPDPNYGTQIQDFALPGHAPEAQMLITYEEVELSLSDGEIVSLRRPTYTLETLGYGPLHPDAMLSPRIAPQMIGLGLLEAIPAADIMAHADPDDANGDGISGRPNIVWSVEYGLPMLGRFGLKAGAPTVRQQSAAAFAGDIGISNPLFPGPWGDCTAAQTNCRAAPHGADPEQGGFEIDAEALEFVTFYSQNLAVPARRDIDDPQVLRGREIFFATGCTGCHVPSFVTHRLQDRPEHSFQLIWPYTDLLLHDMGEGLADHRPEARATGTEWRTPPLWGIGLTQTVSGHTQFLHDGRARSLLEAILWHGGEAEAQRDAVIAMPSHDRAALIRFLESL